MAFFLSSLTDMWDLLVKLIPFLPMPPELATLLPLHAASGHHALNLEMSPRPLYSLSLIHPLKPLLKPPTINGVNPLKRRPLLPGCRLPTPPSRPYKSRRPPPLLTSPPPPLFPLPPSLSADAAELLLRHRFIAVTRSLHRLPSSSEARKRTVVFPVVP
jgi:hypothetical protein